MCGTRLHAIEDHRGERGARVRRGVEWGALERTLPTMAGEHERGWVKGRAKPGHVCRRSGAEAPLTQPGTVAGTMVDVPPDRAGRAGRRPPLPLRAEDERRHPVRSRLVERREDV